MDLSQKLKQEMGEPEDMFVVSCLWSHASHSVRSLNDDVFKAALSTTFILTMGQMTMCNVKGVNRGDKSAENYHERCSSSQSYRTFLSVF